MQKYPQIQELRERIYPINRAISFGNIYNAGTKEIKDKLTDDVVGQIIMQHLKYEGLKKTAKSFEIESLIESKNTDIDASLLKSILKNSIDKVEKVFEATISDKLPSKDRANKQIVQTKVDEALGEIGTNENEQDVILTSDINIWEEKLDEKQIVESDIVTKEMNFQAGSLNVLVVKLTSPEEEKKKEYYENFVSAFLMVYLSFTTPEILLSKIIERYTVPKIENESLKDYNIRSKNIQQLCINVLKTWLETHFSHFNPKLISFLMNFLRETVEVKSSIKALTSEFEEIILENKKDDSYPPPKKILLSNSPKPKPKVNTTSKDSKNIFHHNLFILDVEEEEVARQLSLIDYSKFKKIRPEEFLNRSWERTKLKHRAPNIVHLLQHFDKVVNWIKHLILSAERKVDRIYRMKRLLKIAENLQILNNFNSFFAVLLGITHQSLKIYTIDDLLDKKPDKDKYEEYVTLLKDTSTEIKKSYRELSKKVKKGSPCIPYLYFFLLIFRKVMFDDLAHLDQDIYRKHKNSLLINWNKREILSDQIEEIQNFQLVPYNFVEVYQIQVILSEMDINSKKSIDEMVQN
jgi:son of sevenless